MMSRLFACRLALTTALLLASGCRPAPPFDITLYSVTTGFGSDVSCPGFATTLSGFECAGPDGVCLVRREVERLTLRLEVVSVPERVLGARIPEIVSSACVDGACRAELLGEPLVIECPGGMPAVQCLVTEIGSLERMVDGVLGPVTLDRADVVMFRLVLADASRTCTRDRASCILGCAYSLPLEVGGGDVSATLALDAVDGCNSNALSLCSSFGGVPAD